jgi:hypothetical protein
MNVDAEDALGGGATSQPAASDRGRRVAPAVWALYAGLLVVSLAVAVVFIRYDDFARFRWIGSQGRPWRSFDLFNLAAVLAVFSPVLIGLTTRLVAGRHNVLLLAIAVGTLTAVVVAGAYFYMGFEGPGCIAASSPAIFAASGLLCGVWFATVALATAAIADRGGLVAAGVAGSLLSAVAFGVTFVLSFSIAIGVLYTECLGTPL